MRRLFKPAILKKITTAAKMPPRRSVLPLSTNVHCFRGAARAIWEQIEAASKDMFQGFSPSDRILIKINLNTADPFPASTDPTALGHLLALMNRMGFRNVTVGDCSSISALPTKRVLRKTGLGDVIKANARIALFDEMEWVEVPITGTYWKQIVVPKLIFEVDKIIYLANLKTHKWADFSMALKLGVGLVHPLQRYDLHRDFLQEKTAEIILGIEPDLVFLDAREPFIVGGPAKGETAWGNCVFAGRDALAVDLKGYELLYELKRQRNCLDNFKADPFEMRQFQHARQILGREAQ